MATVPALSLDKRQGQMDWLLEQICLAGQLTTPMYEDVEAKYKAVGALLAAPDSAIALFQPEVFPQGSMSLGTTNRPVKGDEFDLDVVCHLRYCPNATPMEVYESVYARIHSSGLYRPILERKARCLRLNYAGNFHLDIVPACPDTAKAGTALKVPDRELVCWCPGDPKQYAKRFFEACKRRRQIEARDAFLSKSLEPLPSNVPSQFKYPLQRVVQLLKRGRDVYYQGDQDAPASIVLTTLAAELYRGDQSIGEGLLVIIEGIAASIARCQGIVPVRSPTNHEENFTAKWTSDRYERFKKFITFYQCQLDRIARSTGLDGVAEPLSVLYGANYASKAIRAQMDEIQAARDQRRLRVASDSAALTTTSTSGFAIPRNNFFGSSY